MKPDVCAAGSPGSVDVTGLLVAWGKGDASALQRLIPLVQAELQRIAERCMSHERAGHTLQATELVNEAYLRLVDVQRIDWKGRAHFLAMSACVMRRVLVDHARRRRSGKRGGGAVKVTLIEELGGSNEPALDVVALNDTLEALAKFDTRRSRVVELRFFGGLSVEETASVLDVSPDTVIRDWKLAKAWLVRELGKSSRPGSRSHQ